MALLGAGRGQKFPHINPKRRREPTDIVDRDVALGSLHRAHIGPMNPCPVGESLLGETLCGPKPAQVGGHQPTPIRWEV